MNCVCILMIIPPPKAVLGILCRFYHAFDSYMTHAFPHDELKPLTKTYTDSLGECPVPLRRCPSFGEALHCFQ